MGDRAWRLIPSEPLTESRPSPWLARVRAGLVSCLESHPYGYALGVQLVSATDIFLPHEQDYHGFSLLARGRLSGLFLDVGANRGHSARGFMKLVPGWDVLSIEPNPLHERTLAGIAERHAGFRYQMTAADAASGRDVTLYVPVYRTVPLHSAAALTLAEARAAVEQAFPRQAAKIRYMQTAVTTITIDELGVVPQIMKFDVQGNELNALRGAARTLAEAAPELLVEILAGENDLVEYLRGFDYLPFAYDHGSRSFSRYRTLGTAQSRNVFFSTRDLEQLGR